jgi:hypothetical protein
MITTPPGFWRIAAAFGWSPATFVRNASELHEDLQSADLLTQEMNHAWDSSSSICFSSPILVILRMR